MLYADKLKYSNIIKTKFAEIKNFRKEIENSLKSSDKEKYEYMVNIVFAKMSLIEKTLIDLKKEFKNSKDFKENTWKQHKKCKCIG